ncbi:MAG TPA: hypothetical protein VGW38_00620, partial [Chloroflexota bacterium]|nr:hypothetical protein [Chloroflexota bacterium]
QATVRRQSDLATARYQRLLKVARTQQSSLSLRLTRALGAHLVRLGVWLQAVGTTSAAGSSVAGVAPTTPTTMRQFAGEAGA